MKYLYFNTHDIPLMLETNKKRCDKSHQHQIRPPVAGCGAREEIPHICIALGGNLTCRDDAENECIVHERENDSKQVKVF